MSCYDWPRLLEHRFDGDVETPPEWPRVRRHLETCDPCRREAAGLDPTLVFRYAAAWSPDPAEVDAMRQAVRTLRRTSALSEGVAVAGAALGTRRGRGRILAAVLFALVLALVPRPAAQRLVERHESVPAAPATRMLRGAESLAPAIDGVDRPQARVYEWVTDELSVVMVVDESLDV